jgi:hypothetical protein
VGKLPSALEKARIPQIGQKETAANAPQSTTAFSAQPQLFKSNKIIWLNTPSLQRRNIGNQEHRKNNQSLERPSLKQKNGRKIQTTVNPVDDTSRMDCVDAVRLAFAHCLAADWRRLLPVTLRSAFVELQGHSKVADFSTRPCFVAVPLSSSVLSNSQTATYRR